MRNTWWTEPGQIRQLASCTLSFTLERYGAVFKLSPGSKNFINIRWATLTGEFTSARLATLWDKAEPLCCWKVTFNWGEGFIYLETSLEISIEKETGHNFSMFKSEHRVKVKIYGRSKHKTCREDLGDTGTGPNGNINLMRAFNAASNCLSTILQILCLTYHIQIVFLLLE